MFLSNARVTVLIWFPQSCDSGQTLFCSDMYTFQEHLLHLQLAARSGKWIWLKEEYFSVEIKEFQHHIVTNILTLKTTVFCGCYQIYYSLLHLIITVITNLPLNAQIQFQVAVLFGTLEMKNCKNIFNSSMMSIHQSACNNSRSACWIFIKPDVEFFNLCLHIQILAKISQNKTLYMKT